MYIKYVGGGAEGFLMGVMKYFWYISMDHEIFFQIFDGPQNIFLCFILVILFFKFGAQKIDTSHQRDLRKSRHVK